MSRRLLALGIALLLCPVAHGQSFELLAKASPDECFAGVGQPYPQGPPCATGQPKVNQAYVWGLARTGRELWMGTAPNVHCLVLGAYLGQTDPVETTSYVCEFGESPYAPPLPDAVGDWRPARLQVFDLGSGVLTDVTPSDPRLLVTIGIRSAGATDDVVFLGGPSFTGGINVFAFDARTRAYLGSTNLPYANIRKWRSVGGVLYTAAGSRVLRWNGDLADPFRFEEVGVFAGDGVEIADHEGRLFVHTWPPGLMSIWMSPVVPPGGLTAADANAWMKVWDCSAYEPDAVTAGTYGGGGIASFDGWLYFGTMHVPMLATIAHFAAYGQSSDPLELLAAVANTQRAIAIFRGRGFGSGTPEIQLLYGADTLPAYDPVDGWRDLPTGSGPPLYGPSGFGNPFNNYTWTLQSHDDGLYVGTMDWSYLAADLLGLPGLPGNGADLHWFASSSDPARALSTDGLGNVSNYGIRTMVSSEGSLFLGTANPMNLLTDLTDNLPEGGWELRRLGSPVAARYVVGPGPSAANPPRVRVVEPGGVAAAEWTAFGASGHGVNVGAGDLEGMSDEVLAGPGPGPQLGPQVRAFRGDGTPLPKVSFYAYGTLRYGVAATGADADADGHDEIVTGAGPGEVFGPHVRGFDDDGAGVRPLPGLSFFAYFTLRYGVNAAGADVEADGRTELLTGPGPGVVFGPQARAFAYDGSRIAPVGSINGNVFADPQYGCRVAGGDLDGDLDGDGLFAPGPGPALPARVRGFSLGGGLAPLPGLDATPWSGERYGATPAIGDHAAGGAAEVVAGEGPDPAAGSRVVTYAYDGASLAPVAGGAFDGFAGSAYGVRLSAALLY